MSPAVAQGSPSHFDVFSPPNHSHSARSDDSDGLQAPLQVPWSRFQPKSSPSSLDDELHEPAADGPDVSWNAGASRDQDVTRRLLAQDDPIAPSSLPAPADLTMSPAALFLSAFSPSPSTLALGHSAPAAVPAPDPPDAEGQLVAGYTLGPIIGYGGFSVIRTASSPSGGGTVAVKIVKRSDLDRHDNPARARSELDHEAAVWSSLSHEHILPLFSSEHTSYADFFVMLHCPAGSLFDILKRDGRPALPHDDAGTMFRQVVRGVRYLHETAGFVHRDIKLENVLVDEMGVCRITDFGMARRIDECSDASGSSDDDADDDDQTDGLQRHRSAHVSNPRKRQTKAGLPVHLSLIRHHGQQARRQTTVAESAAEAQRRRQKQSQAHHSGSLPYAAPELLSHQLAPRTRPHPAQDMWALGVLLYALLTGRLPFMDAFEPRLQMKILHGAYEMPQGIGRGAERVIGGCLDANVRSRWTIAMVDEMAWGVGWGEVDEGEASCDGREAGEAEAYVYPRREASRGPSRSRSRVHVHHHHVPHRSPNPSSQTHSRQHSRASSQSRLQSQSHDYAPAHPQQLHDIPETAVRATPMRTRTRSHSRASAAPSVCPSASTLTSASDATSCSLSTRSTSTGASPSTSRSASRPGTYYHPLLSPRSRSRPAAHGHGHRGFASPASSSSASASTASPYAYAYAYGSPGPAHEDEVGVVGSPVPSALSAGALSVERGRARKPRKTAGAAGAAGAGEGGSRAESPSPLSPLGMRTPTSPFSSGAAGAGVGGGMSPLSPSIGYGCFAELGRPAEGEAERGALGLGVRDMRDVSRGRTRTTPSARFEIATSAGAASPGSSGRSTTGMDGDDVPGRTAPAPARRAESTPPAPSAWPAPSFVGAGASGVAARRHLHGNAGTKSGAQCAWSSRNASAVFLREPSIGPTHEQQGQITGLKSAPSPAASAPVAVVGTTAAVAASKTAETATRCEKAGTKSAPIDIPVEPGFGVGVKTGKAKMPGAMKMAARSRSVGFELPSAAAAAVAFRP